MFKLLSFPARITAVIIVLIALPLVYYATKYLGGGYLVVEVDKPNGWVVIDSQVYQTPYSAFLRAGRKRLYYGAEGFNETEARVTVLPFRLSKKYTFSPRNPIQYEHSEEEDVLDKFETQNAWVKELPYVASGKFSVEYPQPDGTIYVTFLLKPSNYANGVRDESFIADLRGLKKEVYAWLKDKGASDPTKLTYRWFPFDPDVPQ